MPRTTALRRQHDSLTVLAAGISRAAKALTGAGNPEPLEQLLRQFDTVLTAHLASEDRMLYPEMLGSGDARAAGIASRFCEEMGGLKNNYAKFAARWASSAARLADPAGFRRDWAAIEGALSFRIQRENAELYPLADALSDASERDAG